MTPTVRKTFTADDLPNELVSELFEYLAIASPPGATRASRNVDDIPSLGLGWIRATHVCRRWRQISLNHKRLWADIVLSFPSPRVISEIAHRSEPCAVLLDMDSVVRASRFRDATSLIQSILYREGLFSRAKTIICTFSCDSPVPNAVHYFSRMGLQTSVWMHVLECNEFNHLTTLVLPITHSLYEAGYQSEHAFATFKAPALRKLHLIAVCSQRYWRHFPDGYRPNLEGYYAEAHTGTDSDARLVEMGHLQNFIAGAPALDELRIQGVTFFQDMTDFTETTSLLLPHLTKAHVISTDSTGSFKLTALVRTPLNNWDIQTHIQTLHWPLPLPPLIASRTRDYNTLTIDHSFAVTFVSFSADNVRNSVSIPMRTSPLHHNFAASFARLNLHVQPKSVTMAGHKLESFFDNSHHFFGLIVIGRLDELLAGKTPARGQRDPATWTFLQRVQGVRSIVLYGRQDVGSILTNMSCPYSLTVHCGTALPEGSTPSQRSIIRGLCQSLQTWKQRGESLQCLTITGATGFLSVQEFYDVFPQCQVNVSNEA